MRNQNRLNNLIATVIFLCGIPWTAHAQSDALTQALARNGEAVLRMAKSDVDGIKNLRDYVYLDHFRSGDSIQVYLTKRQEANFRALGLPYAIEHEPGEHFDPRMIDVDEWNSSKSTDCGSVLEAYPTYELYEQMMSDFAADYPNICRLTEIGTLPSGRKLLAVKITDNPDSDENEPRFLYSSTMHGNETAGYILMLRLIREMLCEYGNDANITALIDETEIWINPLANPDGTYHGGNSTVSNARRTNDNLSDLNRNFPDPDNGPHPDGLAYQPETQAFMTFAETYGFNLSSNLHGGAEVANYPWDTWSHAHADEDWWVDVCRQYADSVQAHAPGNYFDGFNNGITNGYAWYEVRGGRQDYTTYFQRGREMTLELSNQKLLSTSQFDNHWNYNRAALYAYMQQAQFGLRGIISDASDGTPIIGHVSITPHDEDNSDVFSRLPMGNYHRYLAPGTYDVEFSAEGYVPQLHTLAVSFLESTVFDVALEPLNPCTLDGGAIATTSPTTNLCSGDGMSDLVQATVSGNSGYGSVFGMVNSGNLMVAASQTGVFNLEGFPEDTYRIYHLSYAEGVDIVVDYASELSGCFDLSNPLTVTNYRVEGGSASVTGSTTVCGDDGLPSVVDATVTGNSGPFGKWVVLNNDLSSVLASSASPDFDFDAFGPGQYKLLHVSYGYGVNLGEQDPQNPSGCLDVSNTLVITVNACESGLAVEVQTLTSTGNAMGITVRSNRSGGGEIRILDLSGRTLRTEDLGHLTAGLPRREEINLGGLSAGVYLCVVRTEGGTWTEKFAVGGNF